MSSGQQPRRTRRFDCSTRWRATAFLIRHASLLLLLGAAGFELTAGESRADAALRPVLANAPNVVIVLLDDVGFGAAETFGGPIPTPTLEGLARNGLRYNRFHIPASARRPAPRC